MAVAFAAAVTVFGNARVGDGVGEEVEPEERVRLNGNVCCTDDFPGGGESISGTTMPGSARAWGGRLARRRRRSASGFGSPSSTRGVDGESPTASGGVGG
jgi:hypothetical protein